VLLLSCNDSKKIEDKLLNNNVLRNFSKLALCETIDKLNYNTREYYFSNAAIIKNDGDNVYIYDKKMFYITDKQLKPNNIVSLKEIDYIIKGKVSDFEVINNKIIILDASRILKQISITNDFEITEIKLENSNEKNSYTGSYSSISNFRNIGLITVNPLIPLNYQNINEVTLGNLFNLDGSLQRTYSIPINKIDANWKENVDFVYVTSFNDLIYFSFQISRKIFVFGSDGVFINELIHPIDKKYWTQPNISNSKIDIGNSISSVPLIKYVTLNTNSFQHDNKYFYCLMYQGKQKSPKLLKCDKEFKIIDEIILDSIPPNMGYKINFIDDRIFLFHDLIYVICNK